MGAILQIMYMSAYPLLFCPFSLRCLLEDGLQRLVEIRDDVFNVLDTDRNL